MSVIIYLDDILIYSNDMYKHKQHVKEVFKDSEKWPVCKCQQMQISQNHHGIP